MPIIQMNDVTGSGAHVIVSELDNNGGINAVKVVHQRFKLQCEPTN